MVAEVFAAAAGTASRRVMWVMWAFMAPLHRLWTSGEGIARALAGAYWK